jgi:hypothetical protein
MIWLTETSRIESSEIFIAISRARLMAAWYRSISKAFFFSLARLPDAAAIFSTMDPAEAQISRIFWAAPISPKGWSSATSQTSGR